MSVSVQGSTVDPHAIPDQETQEPKPWTSVVSVKTADRLAGALKSRVEGEVRFDDMSRALYSTDASNYRQVPIGVVIPKSVEDVVATISLAASTERRFSRAAEARACAGSRAMLPSWPISPNI